MSGSSISVVDASRHSRNATPPKYPAVLPPGADSNWKNRLLLDARGTPYGHTANVLTALRHAPEWAGVFARIGSVRVIGLRREPPFSIEPGRHAALRSTDITYTQEWLERRGIRASRRVVEHAIGAVAGETRS